MNAEGSKSLFVRAQESFVAGEFEEALSQLEHIAQQYPNDKNIVFAQARCLAALGRIDEARRLCWELVERYQHARAEALLDDLSSQSASMNAETIPGDWSEVPGPLPPPLPKHSAARSRRFFLLRLTVLTAVGVAVIVGGLHWRRQNAPPNRWESNSEDLAQLKSKRSEHKRTVRDELMQLTVRPGQTIPTKLWFEDAQGLPDWQPGIYRDVPCIGAPERTLDIYIPMAYRLDPNATFPGLIMSSPGRDHGFWQLENWAERNEVMLIWLNSSSNRTYRQNSIAQDAGLAKVSAILRVDQTMGFAIGVSGGAASSWEMICRYPDNFQGVVMIAFGNSHNNCWFSSHVRVGYINGSNDFNADNVKRTKPKLLARGNEVRQFEFVGGHELGTLKLRERMLGWVVNEERRERGIPIPRRAD